MRLSPCDSGSRRMAETRNAARGEARQSGGSDSERIAQPFSNNPETQANE